MVSRKEGCFYHLWRPPSGATTNRLIPFAGSHSLFSAIKTLGNVIAMFRSEVQRALVTTCSPHIHTPLFFYNLNCYMLSWSHATQAFKVACQRLFNIPRTLATLITRTTSDPVRVQNNVLFKHPPHHWGHCRIGNYRKGHTTIIV